MKAFLLFFLSVINAVNLFSVTLDISADNNFAIKTYSNLIYSNKNYNLSYYTENASIKFSVKDIVLEKFETSKMDIAIGFKLISIDNSTRTINSPYNSSAVSFYENKNNTLFSNVAYVKIYDFLYEDVIAFFGRQDYKLASGILFSDNQKGLTGMRINILNRLYMDKIELAYFRNYQINQTNSNPDNISLISLDKSIRDGNWTLYALYQKNSGITDDILYTFKETNKIYYGASYTVKKNKIYFLGDFCLEKGNSKDLNNNTITHNAYALYTRGEWTQKLPLIGKTRTWLTYLKSSGTRDLNSKENKTFYSYYSQRYNGYEREGLGEIFKSGVYDTVKTSNTITGLPDNLNGLTTVNLGFDFPFKKGIISFDYYSYKATETTNPALSKYIGTEFDIKYTIPFGKRAKLYLIYASFNPESALKYSNQSLKSSKLFSINIEANF